MSAANKKYSLIVPAFLIAGAAVMLTCSNATLVSNDPNAVEFQMPLKFAGGDETVTEVATTFRVTIIAVEDTVIANLAYANGKISGFIENVTAGLDRTIIVEGLFADGTVILRGSIITNVVAGEIVDVEITLFAVAKLVRVSPHFINAAYGKSLVSIIRVDNIAGLTAISLTLAYDFALIKLDSIKAGTELPIGTDFSYNNEGIIEIEISHFGPVVNSSGNANLATAYFRPVPANRCFDSTNLDLSVVTMSAPGVNLNDVYIADGKAHISRGKLVVSDDTLKFGLGVPGLNLDFKTIDISDSCGNEIAFEISTEESWIDLDSALEGITPGSIAIDVDTTGLESGKYEGRVRISSARAVNSPYEIVVKLDLDRSVRNLQVSPRLIYFFADENGAVPATRRIHIEEAYGYNVEFTAAENIPWLNINKTSGTSPDSIFATITTTALEPGTYTDTILITSPGAINSPTYVTIVYVVANVSRNLNISPAYMYYSAEENGGLPANQKIHISEAGGNAILFNAGEEISWLNIDKNNGTTSDSITVSITSTALSPGTYADTIVILSNEADNSPQYVSIVYELTRAPRTLAVEPASLHFSVQQDGAMPPPQTFRVYEPNGYSLLYGIVEDIPWLAVAGVSGFTEDTVSVYVYPAGLWPGLYRDSILIGSDDADNSPIYLTVSLGITVGPKIIEVEPDTLHFVYSPFIEFILVDKFEISEIGGFHIPYSAFENIPWISLSHESGTTEDSITVTANPGLAPGFYVDSIEISSATAVNSPVYVWVTFEVNESQAHLETDPDSVHLEYVQYSDALPTTRFRIYERDGYGIQYGVFEDIPWLYLENVSGNDDDTIIVYFSDSSMDSGIYVDSIMVSSAQAINSPIYVKVTLEIIYMPPPAFDVIPDTLYFIAIENGNLPDSQNFNVYENSYPTPFIVTEAIPWLYVTYDTGFVGSDVTVFISTTNLGPGTYFDSILVSTGSGDYIPAYEYIRYTIDSAEPALTIGGTVRDSSGATLADVLVVAYDNYPNGSVLDSALTDSIGVFNFFDINGNVVLQAFKDGYYPRTVSVAAPDTSVLVTLLDTSAFTRSNEWVDLYCDSSFFLGNLIQPHDIVEAFDPDGVLCGRFVVKTEGVYDSLQVYRDDPGTVGVDEGCVTGDIITLKVNGEIILSDTFAIYPPSYENIEACYKVTRGNRR